MDNEIMTQMQALESKIDTIARSVERIRTYLFWTFVITLVVVILPLIGLFVVIPLFLQNYVGSLDSLSGLL